MSHAHDDTPRAPTHVLCSTWIIPDLATPDPLPDAIPTLRLVCLACQADLLAGEVCACVTRRTCQPRWREWGQRALDLVVVVVIMAIFLQGVGWLVQWLTP